MKTKTLSILVSISILGAAFAVDVRDVTLQQRWPWSRLIDVEFVIDGEAGSNMRYDVALEAKNGSDVLAVPTAAILGNRSALASGVHVLTIDPVAAGFPDTVLTRFNVTVTASNSPAYMIIDLTTGAKTYTYDWSDTTWCNTDEYKSDKMAFKHIPAGTFGMGYIGTLPSSTDQTNHQVRLTQDYWLGVHEVTQTQWNKLMGTWPSYFSNVTDRAYRPVENITLTQIRGAWNVARFACPDTSFIGILAARSGLTMDIPTEAQFEYAQRAGVTVNYYMGITSMITAQSYIRFRENAGGYNYDSYQKLDLRNLTIAEGGTADVGHYPPNAWGLYDMAGNLWEVVYDKGGYKDTTAQIDPVHVPDGTVLEIHGGCFNSPFGSWVYNTSRSTWNCTAVKWEIGFRVMAEYEVK